MNVRSILERKGSDVATIGVDASLADAAALLRDRRIGALVEQYPEPLCEMHPQLAERVGVADGDLVTVTSRRGTITLPAHVVATIRPDTVFIPYHWPGDKAANQLTQRVVDPTSKMPEFKVSAVRVEPAGGRVTTTDVRDFDLQGGAT